MKYTINQKEEQLMILMVALRYQARHNSGTSDSERISDKLYLVESISKSLYNIIFDSYDFAYGLTDEEAEKFSYVDEEYTYRRMVNDGVVDAFRQAAERYGFDYEYTK